MLEHFERVRLAHLPTPLDPLPRLSQFLGDIELWIKRDDLTGLATGGNKARKLEYLLADAMDKGADTLITTGAAQSNHSRQTAAAATVLGMRAVLALTGEMPPSWNGNLLLNDLLGAEVRWLGDVAWGELPARLTAIAEGEEQAGYHPYVVPLGGSAPLGVLGYAAAMQELMAQLEERELPVDRIVFASSSGGTQAGLHIGAEIAGFKGKITAISVAESEDELKNRVAKLISGTLGLLGRPFKLPSARLQIVDRYLGGGYAVLGSAEREAIRVLATHEGILVGPVYTGRALAGMIDMIRLGEIEAGETVLFWHTGDVSTLFAYADALRE